MSNLTGKRHQWCGVIQFSPRSVIILFMVEIRPYIRLNESSVKQLVDIVDCPIVILSTQFITNDIIDIRNYSFHTIISCV